MHGSMDAWILGVHGFHRSMDSMEFTESMDSMDCIESMDGCMDPWMHGF